ncbi:MAG: hypothetical protein NVS2B16_34900 [Chloroflexota bacterium]
MLGVVVLSACQDGEAAVPIRPVSYLALRYEATIPQAFDYTCGASSVATILTYYLDRPTTEAEIIGALRKRYSIEEIARRRETGLSFDDLIFAANQLGYSAEGAHIVSGELRKLAGPVIVHLDKGKFQHFAVLRLVGDNVFYLSDPVVGQVAMSSAEFDSEFSGNILAIWREGTELPRTASLSRPRDGVSLLDTVGRLNNIPTIVPQLVQ